MSLISLCSLAISCAIGRGRGRGRNILDIPEGGEMPEFGEVLEVREASRVGVMPEAMDTLGTEETTQGTGPHLPADPTGVFQEMLVTS
ncbi:hypothetical protein U1Q18_002921 [Sarracenia purpurea var. burkii]